MSTDQEHKQGEKAGATPDLFGVAFAMGEVKGEVKNLRNDLVDFKGAITKDVKEDYNSIDIRVTKLEHRQVWLSGAAAGVGAIITVLLQVALK